MGWWDQGLVVFFLHPYRYLKDKIDPKPIYIILKFSERYEIFSYLFNIMENIIPQYFKLCNMEMTCG